MVVDIHNNDLIYLDSCKNMKARASRVEAMIFLVLKLQNLLKDRDFYKREESEPRLDGDYHIREPLVTQQWDQSRDCGVDVAQWMQLTRLWSTYDLPRIDDETRMRLAIDLVMSKANPMREEILEKATAFWDSCEWKTKNNATNPNKKSWTKPSAKGKTPQVKNQPSPEIVSLDSSGSQSVEIYP
ncbi:hypothetical protein PIB30_066488 [Stylosanthes scabra]|uniref:Ubiquitin-like protease family profile domain-containing protein n=1 Tax=Stylosanthes scabra TaxID=79078 RepID=A0ABU6QM77_9FABA|nr:hypothetical protein [Stylosanthes scabra]